MHPWLQQLIGATEWVLKTLAMVAVLLALVFTHGHGTFLGRDTTYRAPLSVDSDYYSAHRAFQNQTYALVHKFPTRAPGSMFLKALIDATQWTADRAQKQENKAPRVSLVRISDRFGMRYHPILHRQKMHNGVDFAAPRGTPIYAVADGVVTYRNWRGGAGRFVKIAHDGYTSAYAHMSRFAKNLRPGSEVKAGQRIGYVGASGLATGNHLHFSVIVDGRFVDPLNDGLERQEPLREAQFLVDFERGIFNTLNTLNAAAFDLFDTKELDESDLDLMFEDSFL